MRQAGLAGELLATRHGRNAFKIMPVKADREDARAIAELMRLGWFLAGIASRWRPRRRPPC
jgi:transposase